MEIIQFKEANCKGCYKCIRNCDLKAIKFSNEQARILDSECVLCGKCTLVCPQNAKVIKSDLKEIRALLSAGEKVWITVAPSYVSAFDGLSFAQLSAAVKKLGFEGIEETAIGASMVTKEYERLLSERKMNNIISTCCPTINLLVEKYYPELVSYLAPVAAPATAHAKALKMQDPARKVVFLGPCISKKMEASMTEWLDHVMMFDELRDWLAAENISFQDEDPSPKEMHHTISRFYPVPGGILRTFSQELRHTWKTMAVDGLDRCIQVLDTLRTGQISGYFLEMNSCAGGCVQGPGMHAVQGQPLILAEQIIRKNVAKETVTPAPETEKLQPDLSKSFDITLVKDKIPDENTIQSILASIGKYSEKDMLNCGACGYSTCREKAIAVFQGKADLKMCLPYMREKAESTANLILDNTPDAIFLTDPTFNVLEYNPAAAKMFSQIDEDTIGLPIELILSAEDFENLSTGEGNVYYAICHDTTGELTLDISIIHAPNRDYIIICKDVTAEQKKNEDLIKLRQETLETTQHIIDKQMRVAQEIASLLGETTGETKAALINLKKSLMH